MRRLLAPIAILSLAVGIGGPAGASCWTDYLDYAYVYSSAEPRVLRARLDDYAAKCGISLGDYIAERIEKGAVRNPRLGEDAQRRRGIAHLLQYLSTDDPAELGAAVSAIRRLSYRQERRENRYWLHYILAHRALENRDPRAFTRQIQQLWLDVAAELEAPYAALETLSLNDAASAGFLSALPYVYENIARLVILRSQEKGMGRGLDSLGAIVRMLADGRIGGQPDVIPVAVSSRDYLDAVVARLSGPESNGGSLSFTLALLEAGKRHHEAADLLASEGFTAGALQSIRVATGAYQRALGLADTLQGQCAVYTRALRQQGELFAARQRAEGTAEIEIPFSTLQAMELFADLHADVDAGWQRHGYRDHGHQAYLDAMHGLWGEIQESSLNAAAYYRARGDGEDAGAVENRRHAAAIYARYLSFFREYSTPRAGPGVPSFAYFAAYEAALGMADSVLYGATAAPSEGELELAARHYREAMSLYPFGRRARASLVDVLEWQGREIDYLDLVKPGAVAVERSPAVDAWIRNGEEAATHIDALRQALSNDRVLMYFGFSDVARIGELEERLAALQAQRQALAVERSRVEAERDAFAGVRGEALAAAISEGEGADALPAVSSAGPQTDASLEISKLEDQLEAISAQHARLDEQIRARERALPIYRRALEADFLPQRLSAERDHPLHVLLQRIFAESRDDQG